MHTSEKLQQAQACTERFIAHHMPTTRLVAHGDILGPRQPSQGRRRGAELGPGLISAAFFEQQ